MMLHHIIFILFYDSCIYIYTHTLWRGGCGFTMSSGLNTSPEHASLGGHNVICARADVDVNTDIDVYAFVSVSLSFSESVSVCV